MRRTMLMLIIVIAVALVVVPLALGATWTSGLEAAAATWASSY
jgi:hypothetical protein